MTNKKGFTVLELMVGLAIFSLISLMTLSIFSLGIKSNNLQRSQQEGNDSMRLVFNSIEKDIRESSQLVKISFDENTYYLTDLLNGTINSYSLENEILYKNGKYLIDQIKSFDIESLGNLQKIENHTVNEGFKLNLSLDEETIYDYKFYFRHEK